MERSLNSIQLKAAKILRAEHNQKQSAAGICPQTNNAHSRKQSNCSRSTMTYILFILQARFTFVHLFSQVSTKAKQGTMAFASSLAKFLLHLSTNGCSKQEAAFKTKTLRTADIRLNIDTKIMIKVIRTKQKYN